MKWRNKICFIESVRHLNKTCTLHVLNWLFAKNNESAVCLFYFFFSSVIVEKRTFFSLEQFFFILPKISQSKGRLLGGILLQIQKRKDTRKKSIWCIEKVVSSKGEKIIFFSWVTDNWNFFEIIVFFCWPHIFTGNWQVSISIIFLEFGKVSFFAYPPKKWMTWKLYFINYGKK